MTLIHPRVSVFLHSLLTDVLHFVFIEIGKFRKKEEELATNKEKWYYCISNMNRLQGKPEELRSKVFERLFRVTEIESLPKEERIKYIKDMTTDRDIRNQLVYARDMGIAEGKARGKVEGKAETAQAMLANGLGIDLVCRCTGLSEDQVRKIQQA